MVEYFQPAGTPLYDNPFNAVCKERTIPMSQMRGEKQRAIGQAQHLLDYLMEHQADFSEADYYHLLPRYLSLYYYARAAYHLVEAVYGFTNLHIRHYDPECVNPRQHMEQAMEATNDLYLEMLADSRLRYFEPDVYAHGLRLHFMDHVQPVLSGLRFHNRVLSHPEIVDTLPEEEKERALRILANAHIIREKFERNARGEVDAEREWAKLLGDYEGGG